jgi:cytochrome c biogenesis protein CcmG, thiol:disulfide interchange protein DsbE
LSNLNPNLRMSCTRSLQSVIVLTFSGVLLTLLAYAPPALSADTKDASETTAAIDSVLKQTVPLKGKVVYVDFWASWCLPCRHSFPWMKELALKYADRGLQIITVNLDKKHADAEKFLRDTQSAFQVVYDSTGALAELFKVDAMPSSFLYGRDGKLISRYRGFKDDETSSLDSAINVLTSKGAPK